jgi:DNA (cytosine-5)-methyltransferase 1
MISNHVARSVGKVVQQRIDHLGIGQKMQDLPEELWHESFRFLYQLAFRSDLTRVL